MTETFETIINKEREAAREREPNKPTGGPKPNGHDGAAAPPDPALFTAKGWLERDLPEPDFLLGNLFSTTSRGLLVGPTGSGKTNFAMALAFAMAEGKHFLHFGNRPVMGTILYLDGEMSARLLKERIRQAADRHGSVPDNIVFISRDDFENMPPLNTEEGQRFVDRIIERIGNVAFVFFDNVQALLLGDMKDEEAWSNTLPWIKTLTRRNIGQLWLHHTGHDTSRMYGTSTRAWQLDTVMLMKEREKKDGLFVSFDLEFHKARERTPDNRTDFATAHIWLGQDDRWHSAIQPADGSATKKPRKPPSPMARKYLDALADAIGEFGKRDLPFPGAPRAVTRQKWKDAAIRRGLIDGDAQPNKQRAKLYKYQAELIEADRIGVDGDYVWLICDI